MISSLCLVVSPSSSPRRAVDWVPAICWGQPDQYRHVSQGLPVPKTLQDQADGYKPYQSKVMEGDQSYRAFLWGGWYGANVHLLPTLSYQYNDYEMGGHDSGMPHPCAPCSQSMSFSPSRLKSDM